jgi:hypothetical protein
VKTVARTSWKILVGVPLFLSTVAATCQPQPPGYDDPSISPTLHVVPDAALPYALKGATSPSYLGDSGSDPFTQDTYELLDTQAFNINVYNSAIDQPQLAIAGSDPTINAHPNSIPALTVVVEASDPTRIWALSVGGQTISASAFVDGAVPLTVGVDLQSGARLPGKRALVQLGALAAGGVAQVPVMLIGAPGLEIHFDAYGDVDGGTRTLVTKEGTTAAFSPAPAPSSAPSSTPSSGPSPTPSTSPTPPPVITHQLNVTRAGSGLGTVTSTPAGISCGSTCQNTFNDGTPLTLNAVAGADSTFVGWGGACSGTGSCQITLNGADANVTATFQENAPLQVALTVSLVGSGVGTITSAPAGITCGATCSAEYDVGTPVTLTATPASGSTFTGWEGSCSGTGTCTVTLSAATSVSARFDIVIPQYTITVAPAGNGSGSVTSSPAGISCGSTCQATYASGTIITLTAQPASGSDFVGWSGSNCAGTGPCTVAADASKTITATFQVHVCPEQALQISLSGTGTGSVSSNPSGIQCGSKCTASFMQGTSVTLAATAGSDSTFAGWSGACTGVGPCTVTMGQATAVVATFTQNPIQYALAVDVMSDFGSTCQPETHDYCGSHEPACGHCSQSNDDGSSYAGTPHGTVTSSPAGISCGSSCSAQFNQGTTVTLTATPDPTDPNAVFSGWGGVCLSSGTAATCQVTMNQAHSVTAVFRHVQNLYLHARRTYGSGGGCGDGSYSLPQHCSAKVPSEVDVSAGYPDNGWLTVDYGAQLCCYKGNGKQGSPTGSKYEFDHCIDSSDVTGTAGDACSSTKIQSLPTKAGDDCGATGTIGLHIDNGDSCHETDVSLTLPVASWNH